MKVETHTFDTYAEAKAAALAKSRDLPESGWFHSETRIELAYNGEVKEEPCISVDFYLEDERNPDELMSRYQFRWREDKEL